MISYLQNYYFPKEVFLKIKTDFVIKEEWNDLRVKRKVVDANFEKYTVSTFERKISLLQINKDLIIDRLIKKWTVNKEK